MKMKKRFNQVLSIAVLLCLLLTACSTPAKDEGDKDAKKDGDKPLIGVLFRTLAEEKWTKEKDMMIELAEASKKGPWSCIQCCR